jgi:hypothetical protein
VHDKTLGEANKFLADQFELFTEEHSHTTGKLLELIMLNLTFMGMMSEHLQNDGDTNTYRLVQMHVMKCLDIATGMAGISDEEVTIVVDKSIELVDCLRAIADPTHTNVH